MLAQKMKGLNFSPSIIEEVLNGEQICHLSPKKTKFRGRVCLLNKGYVHGTVVLGSCEYLGKKSAKRLKILAAYYDLHRVKEMKEINSLHEHLYMWSFYWPYEYKVKNAAWGKTSSFWVKNVVEVVD